MSFKFSFLKLFEKEEKCKNCDCLNKILVFAQLTNNLDIMLKGVQGFEILNDVFEKLIEETVGSRKEFSICIRSDLENIPHIHLIGIKISDFERKPLFDWISTESLSHLFQNYLVFDINIF